MTVGRAEIRRVEARAVHVEDVHSAKRIVSREGSVCGCIVIDFEAACGKRIAFLLRRLNKRVEIVGFIGIDALTHTVVV